MLIYETYMIRSKKLSILYFFITCFCLILFANDTTIAETEVNDYIIGPNDVLNIFVCREAELTRDVTVMSDGKISFPLIGNITASGKTVAKLRADITAMLNTFIDSPEVTVIVKKSNKLIYVIGNVNRQGPFPLQAEMTVLQALSAAGGFSEWADTKDIIIIRRNGGKEAQIPFNYKETVSGKNLEQNIVLKPNDTIVVP